jgi:hypothetical protein
MVVNLGLTSCEMLSLGRAFGKPHRIRRSVRILNLDHELVQDVSDLFLDGQVNLDSRGTPSRSATISLHDPTHLIGIDTASPFEGVVSPRYLLELHRGLYVDELSRWVDIPCGVLWFTKPNRSGNTLSIEAQGKEALALYPVARQLSFAAGANKMTVIRSIMASIGETRFRLDSTSERLGSNFVVDLSMTSWQACKTIADGMGRQLFYDAEGYLVCRERPVNAVFTFRMGNDGTVRTDPQITASDGTVYNYVRATGATPQGKDAPIAASAHVGSSHQLYLTRNDTFIPLRTDVANDKLTTLSEVEALSVSRLAEVLQDSQSASWESSPVWHLDQGDPVRLTDGLDDDGTGATFSLTVPLGSQSYPLGLGNQSNGYMRLVSRSRRRIGRRAA